MKDHTILRIIIINNTITWPTKKPKAVASTTLFIILIKMNIEQTEDINEISFKATNDDDFFNNLIKIKKIVLTIVNAKEQKRK